MKKILIILSVLGIAVFGLCSCRMKETTEKKSDADEKYTRIVAAIPFMGIPRRDVELIQERINQITEKEIGVTVEFPELSTSYDYYDEVTMRLSTTGQLDIMMAGYGSFMEYYVDGKLEPLDDLLTKYGQGIIRQVGGDKLQYCDIHNICYGIPVNGSYAQQDNCYVMRKDILEKYNINPQDIKTINDLEKVFALVKEKEPQMSVLVSGQTKGTILSNLSFLNTSCGIPVTVCEEKNSQKKLVNLFESEQYKKGLKRVRQWYLKGYIDADVFGETESWTAKVEEGKVFAYTSKKYDWNPGSDDIKIGGVSMVRIALNTDILNPNGYSSKPYVITKNSVSPEAAMKLLNLFYSNEDIADLLCYGIEGIHYKKTAKGYLTFIDKEKGNPFFNHRGNMPNQYIASAWEGQEENYWEQVKKRNETAVQGDKSGFNFDFSKVDTEYRKVVNIYNDYKWILENGLVNPEEVRVKMTEEMKDSGLELIIKEEQRQYDKWRKKKEGKETE